MNYENYKYPIKYAIMPITKYDRLNFGLEESLRRDETICYIVSKCFLISEKIDYFKDGSSKKMFVVVFPCMQDGKEKFLGCNSAGNFISTTNVDLIFDDYEEVKDLAYKMNEELFVKRISSKINFEYDREREKFEQVLELYKLIEENILENTKNLEVKPLEKKLVK